MRQVPKRPNHPRARCGWLALVAVISCLARALPAEDPPPAASDDGPSSAADISNAMQDVRRKYGSDAVMLEGYLLSHAVRNGSVGDTAMSVGGLEDRDGKRFLTFRLETGIIYNDREVAAAARPARVWNDIVEASLRQLHAINLPTDGIALRLGYAHRDYGDEAEVRAHVRDQPGTPETVVFYLLLSDLRDLIGDRITGQQLIERSAALLNGKPVHLILAAPTPAQLTH